MKNSSYKKFKNTLIEIANSEHPIQDLRKNFIFCAGYLWLQLTNRQVYDLIDTLKGTKLITDIDCDGEDYRYYVGDFYVLTDSRQRHAQERG